MLFERADFLRPALSGSVGELDEVGVQERLHVLGYGPVGDFEGFRKLIQIDLLAVGDKFEYLEPGRRAEGLAESQNVSGRVDVSHNGF